MDGVKRSVLEIIGQRNVNMAKIRQIFPSIPDFGVTLDKQVEINAHYLGYLNRQAQDINAYKKDDSYLSLRTLIMTFSGLSNEIKSKLNKIRPNTLGQALRIDGVTPAAAILILSHLKKPRNKRVLA